MAFKATRNMKFVRSNLHGIDYIFRQLSISEINMLDGMESGYYKNELACNICCIEGYLEDLTWQEKQKLGNKILEFSTNLGKNSDYFETIAKKHQLRLNTDHTIDMIKIILENLPGVTIEYLLSLTYEDLIELVCVCEKLANKRFFTFKSTATAMKVGNKKPSQDLPSSLPPGTLISDDGKLFFEETETATLKDKMRDANKFYK